MTQRSEQLVLDYLSEVGLVLHGRLTARERTAYLTSVRARIDALRAAAPDDGVDAVRDILLGLGTPGDLVERDLAGRDLDIEDEELIPPRPRHADRPPPPWRGGPSRGIMGLLEGPGRTEMRLESGGRRGGAGREAGALRGLVLCLRHHSAEMAALALLLATVPWGWGLSFLWVLGVAFVVLSRVWSAKDKWIAVLVPLLGCLAGMALWSGEADFVDQYVQHSLADYGVIGLGLASLVSVAYLYPRAARSARAAERQRASAGPAGHR
ncbi:hypothetical protein ABZ249_17905 [Nocardiopsis sp. NPDC006139]|uniref:hypothetical protein n=1 Tax=unclassified Nocardiopsis TaxID=2649073 RepID=UPI001597D817|nr:hypothetical protein HUT17_03770 [Nocardiopsis flavescens]